VIDISARIVSEEMSKLLGHPMIIEGKPGANGTIAAKYVVNAKPDGYTIYYSPTISIHQIFNKNNAVDAAKELTPISQIVAIPWFLSVRGDLPANSVKELLAYAKSKSVKFGTNTATTQLAATMILNMGGVPLEKIENIQYKGINQIVTGILSGEIDAIFGGLGPYMGHLKNGKVRPLMAAWPKRVRELPDVPSATEVGFPNTEVAAYYGFWAPLNTPKDIVQRLNVAMTNALKVPAVVEKLLVSVPGAEVASSTQEGLLRTHEKEIQFWADAIRLTGYQVP